MMCNIERIHNVHISNDSGLAVYFYPEGKDRILFNGVKSEGGFSKFLIKNMGDSILVRGT